jgi:hypothetical protein
MPVAAIVTAAGNRMHDTPPDAPPAPGPVVLRAPPGGWTWAAYERAIQAFTQERGRPPRIVTLHPETLEAIVRTKLAQTEATLVERAVGLLRREEARLTRLLQGRQRALRVVTAVELDRQTLVLE